MSRKKDVTDAYSYVKGYKIGLAHGKRDALVEFQKENPVKGLPSNEVLFKIFRLLFECKELDEKTSSCYMNQYEHYADYVVTHWEQDE